MVLMGLEFQVTNPYCGNYGWKIRGATFLIAKFLLLHVSTIS